MTDQEKKTISITEMKKMKEDRKAEEKALFDKPNEKKGCSKKEFKEASVIETCLLKTFLPDRMEELNNLHAVTFLGGKTVVMNVTKDKYGRDDLTFSSVNDFKNRYSNVLCNIPGKDDPILVANLWLKSPYRRQFEKIVFDPAAGADIPGIYNLYQGFAVQPKQGDWRIFRQHILEVIANRVESYYHYLINWLADLVQHPGGPRPGTAIALRGGQGTGKGCFFSIFGRIFGNHFLHLTSPRYLTGRFNSHLKDALLVFADEGFWAGDKQTEGILKAMITEPHNWIEAKGKEAIRVDNHIRLMVASNNDWVVPCGMDERRWFVLDVAEHRKQDHQYFKAIFDQMEKNGGLEAMLFDLLSIDLSVVSLRDIPKTEAQFDQKLLAADAIEKFWFECLYKGLLLPNHEYWEQQVVTDDFHKQYLEFAKNIGERYAEGNIKSFGKKIRKLCPKIRNAKPGSRGNQKRCLIFPNLDICRKDFEKSTGCSLKWDEDEI